MRGFRLLRGVGWLLLADVVSRSHVEGALPPIPASIKRAVTIPKVFDATYPPVTSCSTRKPYNRFSHPDSGFLPAPFTTDSGHVPLPPFLRSILGYSIVAAFRSQLNEDSAFAKSAAASFQRSSELADAISQKLLKSLGPELNFRAAGNTSSLCEADDVECSIRGRSLLSIDIPSFDDILAELEAAGILQVLTSQTGVSLLGCLTADSAFVHKNDTSFSFELMATTNGLGKCLCQGLNTGAERKDLLKTRCRLSELLKIGIICELTEDDMCTKPRPVPAITGFDKCDKSLVPAESTTKNPNVDYDLFLYPRTKFVPYGSPFPATITDKDVIDAEGLSYFYLFRSVDRFGSYTSAALCGDENVVEFVPGWESVLLLDAVQEGDGRELKSGRGSIPMGVVMSRGCDVLIIFRGTANRFEWRMDFTYSHSLVNVTDDGGDTILKGAYHEGFAAFALSFIPSIMHFYGTFAKQCVKPEKRVIVSGHSLGAAIGSIVALVLSVKLDGIANVSSVLFASPHSLDVEAAKQYNTLVNSRHIRANLDLIPDIPCSTKYLPGGNPLCGNVAVNTELSAATATYGDIAGVITISAEELAKYSKSDKWTNNKLASVDFPDDFFQKPINVTAFTSANVQFDAFHNCAAACWSGKYCKRGGKWRCDKDCHFISLVHQVFL